jgi:signal transduction histidine kinase
VNGLGLIVSKEFVVKQGGEIWVESKPSEGTTSLFTILQRKIPNTLKYWGF